MIFPKEKPHPLLEACVETLELAVLAEKCGAHRIELCANLETGGLTPSEELILSAKKILNIPIMVIVRPRAGNFVYDETELQEMESSIRFCQRTGIDGVVLGCLTNDGLVDVDSTKRLVHAAGALQVTFHKAIDDTPDPAKSLEALMGINGITRVLTSGGAATAIEGKEMLKRMIDLAVDRLTILAAGKVTGANLQMIHREIGAKEYHGRRIVF